MTSQPAPQPDTDPSEPYDAPVKRIRRGCMFIIGLLILGVGFNFLQYRLNVVTLIGGSLLLIAIVAFVLISREQGPKQL